MKHSIFFLVFSVLLLLISGCAQQEQQAPSNNNTSGNSGGGGGTVIPGAVTVTIQNFAFNPPTVNVKPGSTVTWVNKDSAPHRVVNNAITGKGVGEVFDSEILETNEKYSFVFSGEGVFDYYCFLHPSMAGKIIVKK